MERVIRPRAAARLAKRPVLALKPRGSIAIKRDVHEFVVEAAADAFADAFRRVVTDPTATFGLIRVKRPAERMGEPFEVGERFQGCFSLERALAGFTGRAALAERLTGVPGIAALVRGIEDGMLSNYAEVHGIDLEPEPGRPYRLEYRYLKGTPIAGSTVWTIEPLGPRQCRATQVFEYQETDGMALANFQRFGLKFHDQVVHEQVRRAAELVGATATGTVPEAYATLAAAGRAA